MKPNIVVLTDFSPAAEQAVAYAAVLAAPLAAEVHLVHVFSLPPTTPRVAMVMHATTTRFLREKHRSLAQAAAGLPGPVTTDLLEDDWDTAVENALVKYQPPAPPQQLPSDRHKKHQARSRP